MNQNKTAADVREVVSRAYGEAIEKVDRNADGFCQPKPEHPAGFAARTAGYGAEVEDLPESASQCSFGCGNPLALSKVKEGEVVLDLGSGAGLDLLIAARKVGDAGRVIGVDMTDEMIEAARRNIAEAGAKNIEVRKGVIEELPVESNSVDWVISNCVINLSPDKDKAFAEIARVLRPGGHFSISDIVAEDLPEWLREQAVAYTACIGGAISESEYIGGLETAGLCEAQASERFVYDEEQLKGIIASDLEMLGESSDLLDRGIRDVTGKVWSARFTGIKPASRP